ncbi:hypothetical protein BJ912DRAFT_1042377 [Pholiota molesta]|nr:hypothetical protein BJ912DRAFT_1042377 [Pholiota molesta]
MTALPPQAPERLRHLDSIVSAYNVCLNLERALLRDAGNMAGGGKAEGVAKNLIYARTLGYLIHFVPTKEGPTSIVRGITACGDDNAQLLTMGKIYYDHYIRAFKAAKGRVATPSSDESRATFDTIEEMSEALFVDVPQSHSAAKNDVRAIQPLIVRIRVSLRMLAIQALIRDGYRCIVTGKYDARAVHENRELQDIVNADPSTRTAPTECGHIFPLSVYPAREPDSRKRNYAASMYGVMARLCHEDVPRALIRSNIHRLENAMTLVHDFRLGFDAFAFWFAETPVLNTYTLESARAYDLRDYPATVTLRTPDPVLLPLPSPRYLAIHAACARVAQYSGAAELIGRVYQEMDEGRSRGSGGLDPGGGSGGVLERALRALQVGE